MRPPPKMRMKMGCVCAGQNDKRLRRKNWMRLRRKKGDAGVQPILEWACAFHFGMRMHISILVCAFSFWSAHAHQLFSSACEFAGLLLRSL